MTVYVTDTPTMTVDKKRFGWGFARTVRWVDAGQREAMVINGRLIAFNSKGEPAEVVLSVADNFYTLMLLAGGEMTTLQGTDEASYRLSGWWRYDPVRGVQALLKTVDREGFHDAELAEEVGGWRPGCGVIQGAYQAALAKRIVE